MADEQKASLKKALAKFELFMWLTDEELEKVASLSREESFAAGISIMAEGSTATDLYMVEEGQVRVEMSLSVYPGLVQDALVEIIPKGEPFG